MSPEIIGIIGIVVLLALLMTRMWVGAALAVVGFLGVAWIRGLDQALMGVAANAYRNIAFSTISVIPMFVLMGMVVARMGIGADMYESAYKWVGQMRGGLAIATVFACAGFAAITGVSQPALFAMSKIALPEMKKFNYDEKLATGCIVSAAGLAPLIPPSLPMVMYGVLTETPVGKLFIAGIGPGILLAILYISTIIVITAFRPDAGPPGPKTSLKEKVVSLKNIWHVVFLFILVLGGIYAGVFTPTEAGAVGAFGSIIISMAMRRFTIKEFTGAAVETALMTGMILLIMAGAFIFMNFMAVSQVPFWLSDVIAAFNAPPMVIFGVLVIIYVLLGMFVDMMSVIMLTIPIVCPAMSALGFDLIWFGVILILVFQMALLTPPIGMEVFMFAGLTGIPIGTVFRSIWPFCIAILVCIIILATFPQIATFLPSMM